MAHVIGGAYQDWVEEDHDDGGAEEVIVESEGDENGAEHDDDLEPEQLYRAFKHDVAHLQPEKHKNIVEDENFEVDGGILVPEVGSEVGVEHREKIKLVEVEFAYAYNYNVCNFSHYIPPVYNFI